MIRILRVPILHIILLMLLGLSTRAQQYVLPGRTCTNCQLASLKDRVVLLKPENKRVMNWMVLDSNLREESNTRIGLISGPDIRTADFIVFGNRIMYVEQVKEKSGTLVYLTTFNEKGETLSLPIQIKPLQYFAGNTYSDSVNFSILSSGDHSKLIFYQFLQGKDSFTFHFFTLDSNLQVDYYNTIRDDLNPELDDCMIQTAEQSPNFYFFHYDFEDNYRLSTRLSVWQIEGTGRQIRQTKMLIREQKLGYIHVTEEGNLVCFSSVAKNKVGQYRDGLALITYPSDLSGKGSLYHFALDENTAKSVRRTIRPDINSTIYDYFSFDKVEIRGNDRFRIRGAFFRPRLLVASNPLDTNVNSWESIQLNRSNNSMAPPVFKESLPEAGNVAFMENQLSGNHARRLSLMPVLDYVLLDAENKSGELVPSPAEKALITHQSNYSTRTEAYIKTKISDQPYYFTIERKDKTNTLNAAITGTGKNILYDDKNIVVLLSLPSASLGRGWVFFYRNIKSRESGLIRISL